jgi:uncharacterized membrane protein YfcA
MNDSLLLLLAGLLAGGMNALAGGGSFVSLPALIATGVPSVTANASSTVALFPGGVASVWVYRDGLRAVCGVPPVPVAAVTLVGGLTGSLLLLWTPSTLFDRILPWLLLAATVMLTFGARLGPLLRARVRAGLVTILALQFLLGVYGGYFGGAVGLMMLAAWSVLEGADIKVLNAPRTLMVSAANGIAVLCFILAGAVAWLPCLLVGTGAIAGGWCGARLGRRLPPAAIRAVTIAVALTTTAVFFLRGYT